VRIPPGDEIGELARAFNRMAGNLEEQLAQIRETEGTLRAAFAHMADGVAVLDAEGRALLFNPVAEEAFGSQGEKAKGRLLLEIALHPELDRLGDPGFAHRRSMLRRDRVTPTRVSDPADVRHADGGPVRSSVGKPSLSILRVPRWSGRTPPVCFRLPRTSSITRSNTRRRAVGLTYRAAIGRARSLLR
jgi:PAS domain S-box-containing protein